MYGIKAVLTLGLLLTVTDARPESYGGVKGGRNHKSTANAFATAQATAHADGGYLGTAQSSASATANAVASDGTSNAAAAATANAYADGGNIGKVIGSDDANRNANPLGDSDNLQLSSVHGKDSENRSDNQEGGTSVGSHHNTNTGSYGNSGSARGTGQSHDRRPGCEVPAGVKGHRGASGCTDRNIAEKNKPGVSNPYPTNNGYPDLSAGSKYPTSLDGGYGGNNADAQPCISGASGCPKNKPSVLNPYPTYNGNPDSSAGSKYPTSLDSGYGGNNAGAQPCTSGASDCSKNKPSVSNPHPTYNGNPDLSTGSKYPTILDGGYGGNNAGAQPCTSGASGCPKNKPSVSNSHPTYNGNPDLSAGSKYPTILDGGDGGNNAGAQPCTSGASGCPKNKPSVSNPHPTYNGNPDLSAGSKYPTILDGGYGGNNAGAQPCTSGAADCPKNKPSVSNPHPTYNGNPDLSAGSKYPTTLDSGYGGNNAGAQPCTSGAADCPENKSSVSNPHPTYNGKPDLPVGSKYPTIIDGGYGGNNAKPEPPSCSAGASGCSGNKPSVSNPHAPYPGYVDSSPDSQHEVNINHGQVDGHAGKPQDTPCFPGDPRCLAGSKPKPMTPDPSTTGIIQSGPIPCTSGSINCPNTKPGVANPYPTHQKNPDLSSGSKYPMNLNGGYGGKTAGENPSSGSSQYPGSSTKPDTSNPFLNGEIDVSGIKNSVHTGVGPDIKTNPSNPFLNPHSQVLPPTCTKHPEKPNGSYGGSPTAPGYPHEGSSGDSTLPTTKPNPSNPFLSHNGNVDSPNHIQHYGVSTGIQQNTDFPTTQGYRATNAGCHGSTSCASNKSGHPPSSSEYPVNKPNPSNPFLSHNGNVDSTYGVNHPGAGSGVPQNTNLPTAQGHPATNGGCHGSTSCESNKPGHPTSSSEYPVNKPNPSNPFLPHNGEVEKTTGIKYPDLKPPILKNPGSFGESSYDRIDPHSNVNKNYGSQDAPSIYPGKEASGSNPFLGDGQLTNPHLKPGSHETSNSPKPFPGHNIEESPSTKREPGVANGYHGNGNPYGTENQGVKTHQPGVKGGSHRRELPAKLQETELLSGNTAYSTAHASASASAHSSAYASSSSSSGGSHSSAKSDAHSDLGSSGLSNSWASSSASASASASAFASSSSHQDSENWQFPDVPAE